MIPDSYSFTRYLEAKKTVDDRALNRPVWAALAAHLPPGSPEAPRQVLEVGAGTGVMLERMLAWGLLGSAGAAGYTAIDALPENVAEANHRLPRWAPTLGFAATHQALDGWLLQRPGQTVSAEFLAADLFEFARQEANQGRWDLLVAHAFLDLFHLPSVLPVLFGLLRPGGRFYFTINFDGATLLEPALDPAFDELVQGLYHRTMDERRTAGRPSGDSRAGRHMFAHLRQAGAELLAAGSSDWVVFPGPHGYPADEAYFLHFIIHTIGSALAGHPELDPGRFERWVAARHAQVERHELVYIAHQLDFAGVYPGPTLTIASSLQRHT